MEIVNGQSMVSHILIDYTSCDKNCFVIFNINENFREAFECLMEVVDPVIHQAEMETTTDEVLLDAESLLVLIDGLSV
jgi:hypothetical protein